MAKTRNHKRKPKMEQVPTQAVPQPAPKQSFFDKLKRPSQFSKPQLAVFVLAFAAIGYLLIKTFATAPVIATLQAEQMTPSSTGTSSSGFVTNLTNNGTITTPFLWTFNPPVASSAGYFYANGKLLQKITGSGPYVLRLNAGLLNSGNNKLGGSWDTTAGVHQTFPAAYSEKINNVSGSGFVTTLNSNASLNAPYVWAFDPGVSTNNGYFFADGSQLQKISGAGPYAILLNGSALTTGAHNLGHAWDTTAGAHQTPPSAYAVNYIPGSGSTVNSTIINDSTASGGQAAKFGGGVTLTGSVSLASSATSLTVMAHGEQCSGVWPQMTVKVDGQSLISTTVSSTSWAAYSANTSLSSGIHSLTIINSSSGSCLPNLYADVTNFFGQTAPPPVTPTVALSASPASVTSGQSSILTWTSANATSCTASGAWSGTESLSGSVTTGALNQNSTYTLTCIGSGGTATASTSVTVAASSATSFESATLWPRPSPATPSAASAASWRLVPFKDKAGLDSAISNMQAHDYIYYNGTGVLTISSSTSNAYHIGSKNPASRVVIDLGTSKSIWNTAAQSGNYVKFAYTGSGNFYDLWLSAVSNLTIFGGDFSNALNGSGILINAPTHDVTIEDAYLHSIAESGIAVRGSTSSGAASNVYNLTIRAEVDGFAMNPTYDPHADKGTGVHALILHGNSGGIYDSTFAIYGHDSLAPGARSLAGVVWPEGAGGSVIEQGNDTAANYNNDIMYAKGVNLLMKPGYGTNPGSTGVQTGGNIFNLWGNIKLNGNIIGWAEGDNVTGSIIHSDNGSWFPGSPALVVKHGRHTNSNLYTGGSNIKQPYPTTSAGGTALNILYQDIL